MGGSVRRSEASVRRRWGERWPAQCTSEGANTHLLLVDTVAKRVGAVKHLVAQLLLLFIRQLHPIRDAHAVFRRNAVVTEIARCARDVCVAPLARCRTHLARNLCQVDNTQSASCHQKRKDDS